MRVRVDFEGLRDFRLAMMRLPSHYRAEMDRVLEDAGRRMVSEAQRLAPVKTGRLRQSIRWARTGEMEVQVGSDAHYAPFVELGTKPHEIRPRSASVLRFRVGLEEIFARVVHHPGAKAKPFLRPAAEKIAPLIPQMFRQRLGDLLRRRFGAR